jgi:hypothetical protein
VTVFAVQNNAAIAVTLFIWRVEGSLAIILMGTLLLGILIGVFFLAPTVIRSRFTTADLRKKLQKTQEELEQEKRVKLFPGSDADPLPTSSAITDAGKSSTLSEGSGDP